MEVIVTGGAGFIGSHMVSKLLEEDYSVIVVDNLSTGTLHSLEKVMTKIKIIVADIANKEEYFHKIMSHVKKGDVEVVVHLAAITSVEEAEANPSRTIEVNIKGTQNTAKLALELGADKILFSSSAAVYGEPRYLPIDENHPLKPLSLYGKTKLVAEKILYYYRKAYGVKTAILRYFNVYGPRMQETGYAGVIHAFITSILCKKNPVIYGDGNQTRDFIYVGDVVEANIKAIKNPPPKPLNIGTGIETKITTLYRKICSLVGECPKPVHRPPRRGDITRSVASIREATRLINWKPKITLEQGLKKTIKYYAKLEYCYSFSPLQT